MSGDDDNESFGLVLAFDSDDPEFARGFDIGNVYGQLRSEPAHVEATIRAGNAEMLMRCAEEAGYSFAAEPYGDDFVHVTLDRR
jgi:hypothetical protein